MRKILITNDDGIDADGIIRLARAALDLGEVWVVAPIHQRSAASHSITLREPIDVYPHDFPVQGVHAYSCTGTPADCVRVGSLNVMPEKPDLVLSGINFGYNAATDIQYSATVGAAFEAAFQGYRAIAVSEHINGIHEVTDAYLAGLLAEYAEYPLDYGQVVNINFPGCTLDECRGIARNAKTSRSSFYHDHYNVLTELDNGGIRYMVEGDLNLESEPDTDFHSLIDNYVSVGIVNNVG
ncbi:MAG: 5'/3'-nucleotidase SurE [Lachnospiraceae bacterium]|nr:5'/3'-nucleotidase SurE [Lachnospiraceae bacterium]